LKLNAIPQRLEFKKTIHGHTLIDDTYNSNPTSMKSAIDLLDHQAGHKILVIGDMGELGDKSLLFHQQIGAYILTKNIDLVLAVGGESKNIIGQLGNNAFWFENKIKLIKSLKEKLEANSVILIKGSRFMKMEEVVASLVK
jgi:UDP-N-acetylmuramoyl-tripeptide--D-alanyl-D-alanine ligase